MADGQLSGVSRFVFWLTFHRLRHPPARIAYSFATARTLFYPHQFKPLLKFLDNPQKRLLIADDVGLGKTIEAGYILRELEAHQALERILIVVPARLQPKWKREMAARFDESFEIVKGSDLIQQADRVRRGRELEPFRWIVSYESARPKEVWEAIREVRLPVDFVVFDEAHRMRNPDTLQNKLGEALCDGSGDSVVFLSATPVQNRLEDLWNLLRLLGPGEFSQWPIFQSQMECNRLLLAAQRHLAAKPPQVERARDAVSLFSGSPAGKQAASGALFASVRERLGRDEIDRAALTELQADLATLSPLGHIICRTRKREAMPNRAQRDASWRPIQLSVPEQQIYDSVQEICRAAWPGINESWGFRMALLMAYRITASCIPAAIQYFSEKLTHLSADVPLEDEFEDEEHLAGEDLRVWTGAPRNEFQRVVRAFADYDGADSKLDGYMEELRLLWSADDNRGRSRRKVVTFSVFPRTLEYLADRLSRDGIPNRVIHGQISVPDREVVIEDFLERDDIPVLLTSEVGGEGLDLQRASIVINYDLPWNPMVVEQRIGRIDRIGQNAEKIIIRNLVIQGSVEEIVLQRLLDKIEVFRGSIGELDEIIGDEIEKLAAQAVRGEFTEEELVAIVEQRGEVLQHRVKEAREVLARADGLLAADQALIDEINAVIGERQIPAEKELFQFLNEFLATRVAGCQLPSTVLRKVIDLNLQQLASEIESAAPSLGQDALIFARRTATGSVPLTLSREAAYVHPRAELIHLQHPLCRFAVDEVNASETKHSAFAVALKTKLLGPGSYAFSILAVHFKGYRTKTRLVALIADRTSDRVWASQEETIPVIVQILESGQDSEIASPGPQEAASLQQRLYHALDLLEIGWAKQESELDSARRERQTTANRASLDFQLNRAEARLNQLMSSRAADFALRMATARVEKYRRALDAFSRIPPVAPWSGIEHEEIAVGLLQVFKEDSNE